MPQVFNTQILTNAYVASDEQFVSSLNGGILYVDYTKGVEAGMSLLLELSPDGTSWYQETLTDVSNNVTLVEHKMAATGKYRIPINGGIGDLKYRLSAKTVNTAVGVQGTVSVSAKL